MKKRTAILIDGGFFIKRHRTLKKQVNLDPIKTAKELWDMCIRCLDHPK